MGLDYNKAKDKLKEKGTSNWFNPGPGSYKIRFAEELSEPFPDSYTDKISGKKTELEKVRTRIILEGKELQWDITVGQTQASLYGQLVLVGSKLGQLVGKEINLVIKIDNKNKRDFTVLEAVELMKKPE